jgi:hypothetical protein
MTITQRDDGLIALDFGAGGPFLTLSRAQWLALVREIRKAVAK